MTKPFYPALSSVVTADYFPEQLNFLSAATDKILKNIHFRNLITEKSSNSSVFTYKLDVVCSSERLQLDVPGTGLVLLLNPDLADPSIDNSIIPCCLTWSWPIQHFFQNFDNSIFSFKADTFFNFILGISAIEDRELIDSALNAFIDNADPIQQFISDIDARYPALAIPNSVNIDQDTIISNILEAFNQHPNLSLQQFLLENYVIDSNSIEVSLENVSKLFFPFIGVDAVNSLKDLFIPKLSASLELTAGLEIPRTALVPIRPDGTIEEDANIKTTLLFEAGTFKFTTDRGFGFDKFLTVSFPPAYPKAMIGNTGLTIGFTSAKLDLSKMTNIPEADAAGYPPDFTGLYIQQASVGFTAFGTDNTSKASAALYAKNLFIGTGGISGTIGLESNGLLHRDFGSFKAELDTFDLTFRYGAITSSNIAGKLTIPGFSLSGGAAVIDIQAHIRDNGDFTVSAVPETALRPLTLPDVFEFYPRSLEIGEERGHYYVAVAGKLNFIADLPVLGDILPKEIEIEQLKIYDDGRLEFEGGKLALSKAFRLSIGPVKMEVTNISLSPYHRMHQGQERQYAVFGFDGMVNTGNAGIDAVGNGIKYYFTIDQGEGKPFDQFLSVDQLAIHMTIPGTAAPEDAAFILDGYLSMHNPDPAILGSDAGEEYSGAVTFALPKLHLAGSAGMRLNPSVPAFVVDIGLELATPVPLGATGLGIYGFRGLLGQHYLPSKSATTPPLADNATWWDYYKAKSTITGREGIELDKFASKSGFSVGAGVSIATAFDSGYIFSSKLFLLLGLPDVFLIQGQAGILRERLGLGDDADPPFSALIVFGDHSVQGNLQVQYGLPSSGSYKSDIFSLKGALDMAFFFNNASGWYLNIGKDRPESERIQAKILTLFQGYAYLMLSSQGIKAGAGVSFDFNKSFGPVGVGLGAFLNLAGFLSFKPVQIGGSIQVGGYAYLKIWKFKLGLSVTLGLAVEAPHPFNIIGSLQLKINLPWPLKDVKFTLDMSWRFNNNQQELLEPIAVLQLPDTAQGYLPATAVHILSNETFGLNYVTRDDTDQIPIPGAATWKYNFLAPEDLRQVTIPLDSFIDIELLKPVNPDRVALGGVNNQLPGSYTELLPPQKGVNAQVKHQYEITALDIWAWKEDGGQGSWVPYQIYEAVSAIADANVGAGAVDLSQLKPGYWQFAEPGKYNKIRLLSQSMFSYANGAISDTYQLDAQNFRQGDLFCYETIAQSQVLNWKAVATGTIYPADTQVNMNGAEVLFSGAQGQVGIESGTGAQVLQLDATEGAVTIVLPQPVTALELDLGSVGHQLEVQFVQTQYLPAAFSQALPVDATVSTAYRSPQTEGQVITFNDPAQAIDKVRLQWRNAAPPDFTGDFVLGGHEPLPADALTQGLPAIYRLLESERELAGVTLYSHSLTSAQVVAGNQATMQGVAGRWSMDQVTDQDGRYRGLLHGAVNSLPGYYELGAEQELNLRQVFSFTSGEDALTVPYQQELEVEQGSFAVEVTAIFDPRQAGIMTLLSKVSQDPVTGSRRGFTLHVSQDILGNPDANYSAAGDALPEYTVWLTVYNGQGHWCVPVRDVYTLDAGTGKLLDRQYKSITVSIDRTAGQLTMYVDKQLKLSQPLPAILELETEVITPVTCLRQLSYLTQEQHRRLTETPRSEAQLIDELQLLSDGINRTVQPVWRPDTTFAIRIKTQDRVNGQVPVQGIKTHIFGFKTAGPVGHFHQQSQAYQALAETDRQQEFALASLKSYIDYERSYPDAQSRYTLSKPVFTQNPQVHLFFVQPYLNAMYANWHSYHDLGAVQSQLEIQLLDPDGTQIVQQLRTAPAVEITIDETNVGTLPQEQQLLYYLNQAAVQGSCNATPIGLKKRIQRQYYQFPDLQPNKMYTALFNAIYQPAGTAPQQQEVHRFNFMTSRYTTFAEQAGSFVLNDTAGEESYAIDTRGLSWTATELTQRLTPLLDTDATNDPQDMLNFTGAFDRVVYGGFGLQDLEPVSDSRLTLLLNTDPETGQKRLAGLLIRNPEPFNDPKLPADQLKDTVSVHWKKADGTVMDAGALIYLHAADNASVLITSNELDLPLTALMQLEFIFKPFNGTDYLTLRERYLSPVINLPAYLPA